MTSPSWFRLWRFNFLSASNRGGRKARHRTRRPFLLLERLEDRMVPSTASSNVAGGLNNATINPAPPSIGVVLPTPSSQQNNSGLASAAFPNATQTTVSGILAATQNQGQLYSQFRSVSVNSQGQTDPFLQATFTTQAFGFGSGTQPGQPWVGAAYNVGLANHQFSFSSNSDQGFQVPPPWSRSIDYNQEIDGETDEDNEAQLIGPDKPTLSNEEEESAGENSQDIPADRSLIRMQPPTENDSDGSQRVPGATEKPSVADKGTAHEAVVWDDRFSYAVASIPDNHRLSANREHTEDETAEAGFHFSDLPTFTRSLSFVSLTPLQFSALLTGLAVSAYQVKSANKWPEQISEEWEEEPAA